jgi:uncharacterized C2H2 Zn-finger protein
LKDFPLNRLNYSTDSILRGILEEMVGKISKCNSCGKYFNSKRELKNHIDKNHRITNSKMAAGTTKHAVLNSSKRSTRYNQKRSNGK